MSDFIERQVSRDERQEEAKLKWIKNKCKGTLVQPTGCGKTVTALKCLKTVVSKYPNLSILVVVPTDNLKQQWEIQLEAWNINANVQVINSVIKNTCNVDILVLDEAHRYAASCFARVFEVVKFHYILGLTATFERVDGRHQIISKYCPVIDVITVEEALKNGWISEYKEYQVLIDVDDIDTYNEYNRQFQEDFEFFDYDFSLVMSLLGPQGFINRSKLRDLRCKDGGDRKAMFTAITHHATSFMRALQARKSFINNHPKKIEIARKIIEARSDSRIITFSNNIKMAESIGMGGVVYSGKDSKKKGRITLQEFESGTYNLIHSICKLNEGADLKGLSVGIVLGIDSSKIKATQKLGRVIRKEGNKQAEMFNIIINGTIESKWFLESHKNRSYITIDEEGLYDVLAGKEPKPYNKPIGGFTFRY